MTTANAPAGWYPDPDGSGGQRFWDGAQWTEHHVPAPGPPSGPRRAPLSEDTPPITAAEPEATEKTGDTTAYTEFSATAAMPPKDPRTTLLQRYGIGIAAGFALLIGIVLWAALRENDIATIELGSPATRTSSNTTSAPPTEPHKTAETATPATKIPAVSAPGEGVNANIDFVITAVDSATTVTSPTNEYLTKDAQGQFIIVSMSVTNTGAEPGYYNSYLQKLISAGTFYEVDPEASNYLSSVYEELAPGEKVVTTLVFDVPTGTVPDAIELHGDAIAPGTVVPLQ